MFTQLGAHASFVKSLTLQRLYESGFFVWISSAQEHLVLVPSGICVEFDECRARSQFPKARFRTQSRPKTA